MTEASTSACSSPRIRREFDAAAFCLVALVAVAAFITSNHSWMVGTGLYYTWVFLWGRRNLTLHCDEQGDELVLLHRLNAS